MSRCVFTGSFDPFTLGHLDIVKKAVGIFDKVYVAVLKNQFKETMYNMDQRRELAQAAVDGLPNVEVVAYDGLAVDAARSLGAVVLLRGIRNNTDLDYEREMELVNFGLDSKIKTVYLLTDLPQVSSTAARQLIEHGGDLYPVLTGKQIETVKKFMKRR